MEFISVLFDLALGLQRSNVRCRPLRWHGSVYARDRVQLRLRQNACRAALSSNAGPDPREQETKRIKKNA